ncbi:hypothetical protein L1987_66829 [Smallanthus sonchifolius]|uniref:Uncharacterized protein n=1 Tax=Smallanthus sonchifolius TaxID=185202 RepID=A0ACB9BY78_9ASTR|nr:hypothetical protein L1987_66829 [Smallanthus sonchifolius]
MKACSSSSIQERSLLPFHFDGDGYGSFHSIMNLLFCRIEFVGLDNAFTAFARDEDAFDGPLIGTRLRHGRANYWHGPYVVTAIYYSVLLDRPDPYVVN